MDPFDYGKMAAVAMNAVVSDTHSSLHKSSHSKSVAASRPSVSISSLTMTKPEPLHCDGCVRPMLGLPVVSNSPRARNLASSFSFSSY